MTDEPNIPEPTNISANHLTIKNLVVGGKWHQPDKPVKHAAFRLAYVMISERYAPAAVYSTLCTVFGDTGLLTHDECRGVVNVSCGFAGMAVQGIV